MSPRRCRCPSFYRGIAVVPRHLLFFVVLLGQVTQTPLTVALAARKDSAPRTTHAGHTADAKGRTRTRPHPSKKRRLHRDAASPRHRQRDHAAWLANLKQSLAANTKRPRQHAPRSPPRAARADHRPQPGLEALTRLDNAEPAARGWFARLRKLLLGNGNLRAGLMGFSDGVASTFGLVVASVALMDPSLILLAGLGGMIAGATSMAAGEYASIHYDNAHERSHKTRLDKSLSQRDGKQAAQLLLEIGHERDIPLQRLTVIAAHLAHDPASLRRYAGELGLDHGTQPSPIGAASSSFASFLAGAAVPLSPLIFGVTGATAIVASATASAIALTAVGTKLSQMSGEFSSRNALRLVAAAGVGAGLSFVVGSLISHWVPLPEGIDL